MLNANDLIADARSVKKNGWDVGGWLSDHPSMQLSRAMNHSACPAWLADAIEYELNQRELATIANEK